MGLLRSLFGDDVSVLREADFQLLLLANVLPPLGSALLSPMLELLIAPFGVSAADIGLLMSVFTAPAIVMIPVAGALADRYGRKPILVSGLVLFGVAGSAIAATTDFRVALLLRLLQGIAFGGITPIIITSIGDLYGGTREATAQGLRFTGSGITQAVFPLLSGVLVVVAWWYPFLLYAIALPIGGAMLLWFEEPTDRSATGSDPDAAIDGGTAAPGLYALLGLLGQRRVLAMVIARGLPMLVWVGFITYNSIVVVRLIGGTPAQSGGLVAVASLSYAGAASQAGRITAFFDSRLYPLLGANVLLGIGFSVVLFAPSVLVAAAGITLTGMGFGVALSLYRSIITGLATESLRGGLVSVAEAFGRVTSTLTPVVMGAAIGGATPVIGFAAAVQSAGVGVALVGSTGGVACLLLANAAPEVRHDVR